MKRRVVITGLGAVTPVGNTVTEMWESIASGKNGIDFITQFDSTTSKVKIAGEVKNLDIEKYINPKDVKRMDRAIALGVIAASEAYEDANMEQANINRDRFGVFVTSGIGGLTTINNESWKIYEKGLDRASPFFVPNAIINLIGGQIAIKYQLTGPALPVVTACSAGTNAIGEAFRYIRDGYIELALAGGAEAPINALGIAGFASMRALNMSNDPSHASIPFDKNRSGFVIAEGAGVLLLEELEHALARNAKIYAEIVGYGTTCDAFHITAPDETASGISKCLTNALNDAGIEPDQIDYINAHGTATVYNDKLETLGIKKVFGDYAYQINISSTKSMTGHALGAIGGIEAVICVKAIENELVPPTINLEEPDEECDLNYTRGVSVHRTINYALSNSAGFGGQNAAIIFKKYQK